MTSRRLFFTVLAFLVVFPFLPEFAAAQVSVTGKIAGLVADQSGAGGPNVPVTVKSPALLSQRTTQTSSDGSYLFDLLPPGTYELTVGATGFRSFRETGIAIT